MTNRTDASADDFASKIQQIDLELLRLLIERGVAMKSWGGASPGAIPPVWELQRMATSTLETHGSAEPLNNDLVAQLFRNIASTCYHSTQKKERIAYLGPIYTYSYLAAIRYFGESAELVPVATIGAVFDEVRRNNAAWGVVPIENSTDGRIVDTLTMFAKHPVRICGEVLFPVHHCLLGRCSRAEVREVYSKPQPISQCRAWLAQALPDAKLIELSSTAAAARMAAEKPGAAAIASYEAGVHHGLNAIDTNIEDNPNNSTRFAVIGHQASPPTGKDKTSIMFRVPHKPGALADAMLVFRQSRLNLTWIESFPIPESPSEYLFFIEMEGHCDQKNVSDAIAQLAKQAVRLEVLGSYPQG